MSSTLVNEDRQDKDSIPDNEIKTDQSSDTISNYKAISYPPTDTNIQSNGSSCCAVLLKYFSFLCPKDYETEETLTIDSALHDGNRHDSDTLPDVDIEECPCRDTTMSYQQSYDY